MYFEKDSEIDQLLLRFANNACDAGESSCIYLFQKQTKNEILLGTVEMCMLFFLRPSKGISLRGFCVIHTSDPLQTEGFPCCFVAKIDHEKSYSLSLLLLIRTTPMVSSSQSCLPFESTSHKHLVLADLP